MPKKYVICDLVPDDLGGLVPRVANEPLPEGTSAAYAYVPEKPWALCFLRNDSVELPRFTGPGFYEVPEFPYVGALNAMNPSERSRMSNRIEAFGANVSHISGNSSFIEMLRGLGTQVDPNFDPDNFGIPR